MLNDCLNFFIGCLNAVGDILGSPPLIYICGFVLASLVIKIFKTLIT